VALGFAVNAEAVAAIPILVSVLAPEAPASTFAEVSGWSAIAAFERGRLTPLDGRLLAVAAPKEMVLPAKIMIDRADKLISAMATVGQKDPCTRFAGNGILDLSGDGGPATSAENRRPGDGFGNSGRPYIADPWNSAIRVLR
jgi:hypothetical protein